MAALLVGGAYLTIEKIREKREKKRQRKKHNEERYAELERETEASALARQQSGLNGLPSDPSVAASSTAEPRQSGGAHNNPFRQRTDTDLTYGTTSIGGTQTDGERRSTDSESDHEGSAAIQEVQARLRSASQTSSGRRLSRTGPAPEQGMIRMTTGEKLFSVNGK